MLSFLFYPLDIFQCLPTVRYFHRLKNSVRIGSPLDKELDLQRKAGRLADNYTES